MTDLGLSICIYELNDIDLVNYMILFTLIKIRYIQKGDLQKGDIQLNASLAKIEKKVTTDKATSIISIRNVMLNCLTM